MRDRPPQFIMTATAGQPRNASIDERFQTTVRPNARFESVDPIRHPMIALV